MSALTLFINLDEGDPAKAPVTSFADDSPLSEPPRFTRSDSRPTRLIFLRRTQDANNPYPFYFVDPSGFSSTKFAGGIIGATPDGGTFTLTSSISGTTSAIAYNAVAATTVQTAVRTLGGMGAATVTGSDGGPYSIDSQSTSNGTLALTGSAAALAPDGSTVVIVKTQTANGSLTNRWQVSLAKAYPILKTSGWVALPSALVTPSVLQAGSGTVNKAFRLVWNADAVNGSVSVSFTGISTTKTVGPIPFSANADDVAAAFALHPEVLTDGVSVVKNGPGDFTITCIGATIKLSDAPALATSNNTLIVPLGLSATVVVSTAGADAILGSDNSAEITLEVEIRESAGEPNTCMQAQGTLLKDLIVNTPGMATGNEDWATVSDVQTAAWKWAVKTTTYTAVSGDKIQADTLGGSWTLTLPAAPAVGDGIQIQDASLNWNLDTLTIARNGLKINGTTSNYTADVMGGKLSCVYISAGYGWSIK